MQRFFLLLILVIVTVGASIAQNHFVFIQSETKKPFTVTVQDKKFVSTPTGYVIIPKLKVGQHTLLVQASEASPLKYTVTIDKKDIGFTFRNLDGTNAKLLNQQTFASIAPINAASSLSDSYASIEKKTQEQPKTDDVKGSTSAVEKNTTTATKVVEKQTAPQATITKLKKGVNKISEAHDQQGISMLFVDVQGEIFDTIDVVIPVNNEESNGANNLLNSALFHWASNNESQNKLEYDLQEGYNNKCVHLVGKEDYAKLRKRMSAENSEDKMIDEALKFANTKCFTTLQVKNLSSLFVKDQGKLKFFNALYNAVYDYGFYYQLESELLGPECKSKFKSLIQK